MHTNPTLETIKLIKQPLNSSRILVVGDVMLDRYWFGDVKRISPEAPVPIAKINKIENRPGGAANVARNIATLGGNVSLLSTIGNDEAALEIIKCLDHYRVQHMLELSNDIKTTVKLRVVAHAQQLIRLDFEEPPSHQILDANLDLYKQIVDQYDVIVFSDYGKGTLSHVAQMIQIARSNNKITLVDPKGNNYAKYANATLITPNKHEFFEATCFCKDEDEIYAQSLKLKQHLNSDAILITRSEEGMSLIDYDNKKIDYVTTSKEVSDVSGAGDTVIATIALMLSNNVSLTDAVAIANIAAGIVVGKSGTATVSYEELIGEITSSAAT